MAGKPLHTSFDMNDDHRSCRSREEVVNSLRVRAVAAVDSYSDRRGDGQLPVSMVEAEFAAGALLNLDLFFRFFRTGVEPTEDETQPLIRRAMDLVKGGMPLADILYNYRVTTRLIWSALLEHSSEQARTALLDMALPLMQYLSITTSRIAIACVEYANDSRSDLIEQRRRVGSALLTGRDPWDWASDIEVAIADRFLVAVCRSVNTGCEAAMRVRTRIRLMPNTFLVREGDGWTALIPIEEHDEDGTAPIDEMQAVLSATVDDCLAPSLWVGVSPAQTRLDIPMRAAEARVLSEIGRSLGHREMICRKDELRLEYIVASSSDDARQWMAKALDPLDNHPQLQSTVAAFVDCAFNQAAAARTLHLHRNSIAYRLSRIHDLTGFDPMLPSDAIALAAAQTARRLRSSAAT
ncbi:CdaR family transcriptional regulator [Nocardia sp. CS682]|uniref:PucR family transcriptional regulator n=1 Tax=Nocardia sp. CS682 TaxID=1047172 RepID=UPI001075182C|nr:helix-turn-helix domain-containing protein [Nocardia sp. CS682]QBS45307.1 hypothetical protein DMB37_39750 [Nocardia sp. CS682]